MSVKINLFLKSHQSRKYPDLDKGDKVKIYKKRKPGEKERVSLWSDNAYEIEDISTSFGQKFYKLVGLERDYMRSELLKNRSE
jgi:hypothetical protein